MVLPRFCLALILTASGAAGYAGQAKGQAGKPGQDIVYVTKTGKKFHRTGCRSLRISAFPMARSEAIAKGYSACHVCKP